MKGINSKALEEIISDLEDIKTRLVETKEEAEAYAEERSDKWRDSDTGQEFDERLGEMDEAECAIDELIEKFNYIGG